MVFNNTFTIPPIIESYLSDTSLVYDPGSGTPQWVETALFDRQSVTLTWYGPRGKGAFVQWSDSDTEMEIYGHTVCRYDAVAGRLVAIAWRSVASPNSTFLVPGVVKLGYDAGGTPTQEVVDVALPTYVAPRPIYIPKDTPFQHITSTGAEVGNCIVTFGAPKWPDVLEEIRMETQFSTGLTLPQDEILRLARGLDP
jgi:hypothetical protein